MSEPNLTAQRYRLIIDGSETEESRSETSSANAASATTPSAPITSAAGGSTDPTSATDFTSTAGGSAPPTATDFTSGSGSSDPLPPKEDPLEITSEVPDRDAPGQGGGGNKKANIPDIILKIYTPEALALNQEWYPVPISTQLKWEMGPGIEVPEKFRVYRDGFLCRTIDAKDKVIWNYPELFVIPNMDYTYKVAAVDAGNNEYAFSPSLKYTVPSTTENHNLITKVGVFPCRFNDSQDPPADLDVLEELMFSGEKSIRNFFLENSYGKMDFTGEVFPEVTLDKPTSYFYDVVDGGIDWKPGRVYDEMFPIADELYGADNYDIWIIPTGGFEANGFNSGRFQIFEANPLGPEEIAHEIGHYLGTNHGLSWKGPNGVVGPNVKKLKDGGYSAALYDDLFNPMGVSIRHFTAYEKEVFGWIPPEQSLFLTEPGLYDLEVLESPGNGIKHLKINFPNVNKKIFYSLEYRKPIGFDAPLIGEGHPTEQLNIGKVLTTGEELHGVLLRLKWDQYSAEQDSFGSTGTYLPKTIITPDNSFEDEHRNITISIDSFPDDKTVRLNIEGDLS